MHGGLPAAADEGRRHDDARRGDGIGLQRGAGARSRNRRPDARNRRAHRLRIARLRSVAAPVERRAGSLPHPRRRDARRRHRKDAAGTGFQAVGFRPRHLRVLGRLAHAHRAGQTAAATPLDLPAGRTDQPSGHRVDPVVGGVSEKLQRRRARHFARPRLSGQRHHTHRRTVAGQDLRLQGALLEIRRTARRTACAAAGRLREPAADDRKDRRVHREVPLQAHQVEPGAVAHQTARTHRAHRGRRGGRRHAQHQVSARAPLGTDRGRSEGSRHVVRGETRLLGRRLHHRTRAEDRAGGPQRRGQDDLRANAHRPARADRRVDPAGRQRPRRVLRPESGRPDGG